MNNTQTCTNLFGQRVTVFRNDHVGDKIVSQGLYEKENLELLLRLLRTLAQPVVLDIGANIGNHTLAFATVASHVHAFEPIPCIHALLRQNVEQNALVNVTLHALALSDSDGAATIHMVTDGNYGASSFDQRSAQTEAVSVQRRRGDALLAELGVDRVDFIKIDVEAHEVYVLRGLMDMLQRQRPFITMEWNDPLTIERLRGSAELQFLTDHYRILVLGSSWDRAWWAGKPLALLRRKLAKLLGTRRAVLYPFDPTRLYKNLLLIPKERLAVLEQLQPGVDSPLGRDV
jgi:FkbM family methyltransferase